ncbi:hypothetical protein HN51_030950 [Arachis hypogaea]
MQVCSHGRIHNMHDHKRINLLPLLLLHEEAPDTGNINSLTEVAYATVDFEFPLQNWVHIRCEVLTEYFLVSVTGAATVTIAGVVKEAVTILVAVLYFHDKFTWVKGLGLCTILFGVSLFSWYKYLKLQKGHFGEGEVAVLHTTDSASKYVIIEEMD